MMNRRKILSLAAFVAVMFLASHLSAQAIGLDEFNKMRTPTTPKIERGEQLFETQGCTSCHGDKGGELKSEYGGKVSDLVTDFPESKFKYGGGLIQIYNFISFGKSESDHSTYGFLPYQDRWALAHYIRSLGNTTVEDPPEVLKEAKDMAKNGVCNPQVKSNLSDKAEPKGKQQMELAKKVYSTNCASCHGEKGKGNGPAAQALNPSPRNFHVEKKDAWTKGTSPFAIYNVLKNGIAGTSMASFSSLSKEKRWALVHYIRKWVPDSIQTEPTEKQILETCRAMSSAAPPEPITIEQALDGMASDYNRTEQRQLQISAYPPMKKPEKADATRGEDIFENECSSCHGSRGRGTVMGPKGSQPPYLYIRVRPMVSAMAGGTHTEFAKRSFGGVHSTLPGMTDAATLTAQEWKDLQAYVSQFENETKESN